MKQGYTHVSFVLDNSGSMRHLRTDTIGGYNSFLAKQKEDPGKMTFSLYQFNREPTVGIRSIQPAIMPSVQPIQPFVSPWPPLANGSVVGMTGAAGQPAPSVGGVGVAVTGSTEAFPLGGVIGSASINASPGFLWNGTSQTVVRKPGSVSTTYEFADLKTVPELSLATYECDTNTPLLDTIGHALDETGRILAALPEEERPEKVIFVILTDGEENASQVYLRPQVVAKIKEQTDVYNWDFLFLGANQDAIQSGHSYGITRGRSMSLSATSASMGSTYNAVSETVTQMKAANFTKDVNFDESIRSAVLDGTYKGK